MAKGIGKWYVEVYRVKHTGERPILEVFRQFAQTTTIEPPYRRGEGTAYLIWSGRYSYYVVFGKWLKRVPRRVSRKWSEDEKMAFILGAVELDESPEEIRDWR